MFNLLMPGTSTCHVNRDFCSLILFTHRWFQKCLGTKKSFVSPAYLACLPFSLILGGLEENHHLYYYY